MTGNELLKDAGKVSHQQAIDKANIEYEKYKNAMRNEISEVEQHFLAQIEIASKKLK